MKQLLTNVTGLSCAILKGNQEPKQLSKVPNIVLFFKGHSEVGQMLYRRKESLKGSLLERQLVDSSVSKEYPTGILAIVLMWGES